MRANSTIHQNCHANEPDVNHPWPNIVITWDKLTHSVQWNKDFDWFTQATVTAWLYSCTLVYISRSGTHGFSSATRLSNVATSRQLCTYEQIENHHSTSLSKQRYQKPLIKSIPFHEIWYLYVLYRVSTSYPYCHFELTIDSYFSAHSWPTYGKFRQPQRSSCLRCRFKTSHALHVFMNARMNQLF